MSEPIPLSVAIGQRVRTLRESRGVTAAQIAAAACGVGIRWERSTVASIETGRRGLSAEELLALPLILSDAEVAEVGVTALLPTDGATALSRELTVRSSALLALIDGTHGHLTGHPFDTPADREAAAAAPSVMKGLQALQRVRAGQRQLWPQATERDLRRALLAATGDAERKAARRLSGDLQRSVTATDVSLVAHARWGRSLTQQRDHLVAERGHVADPRRVQAVRGHVTRELLAEVRTQLERSAGTGRTKGSSQ